MAEQLFYLIKDLGFPIFVCLVLLFDKIKTGEKMIIALNTNTEILRRVEKFVCK